MPTNAIFARQSIGTMNLKINRIQHIGIPVTDIARSTVFYEKLGFTNTMATTFMYNGDTGKVVMMQQEEMIIELYQMPEKELVAIRQRTDGRIDHIAFDVDDIDSTFDTLKNANFILLEAAPVFLPFWKNGCKYFNISGPDGERLEFNQIL
jgi:catechol 2,3-dioxygenase-like lactoylglutathione lyase family enzyme